jgi:chromosome segregation ATPase
MTTEERNIRLSQDILDRLADIAPKADVTVDQMASVIVALDLAASVDLRIELKDKTIKGLREAMDAKTSELEAAYKAIDARTSEVMRGREQHSLDIAKKDAELQTSKGLLANRDEKIAYLNARVDTLLKDAMRYRTQDDKDRLIASYERDLKAQIELTRTYMDEAKKLSGKVDGLSTSVRILEKDVKQRSIDIENKDREIKACYDVMDAKNQTIKFLGDKVASLEKDVHKIYRADGGFDLVQSAAMVVGFRVACAKKMDHDAKAIVGLKQANAKLKNEKTEILAQLTKVNSTVATKEARKNELMDEVNVLERRCNSLHEQTVHQRNHIEKLEHEAKEHDFKFLDAEKGERERCISILGATNLIQTVHIRGFYGEVIKTVDITIQLPKDKVRSLLDPKNDQHAKGCTTFNDAHKSLLAVLNSGKEGAK